MWLDQVNALIRTTIKDVRGRTFFGTVEVNSVLRTQNDIADYLLQVNKQCFITGGDAIVWDGSKFLVGTGVTENLHGPLTRSFRLIRVDLELAWTRAAGSVDTLTGLQKETSDTAVGTALVSSQATSKNSDVFRVETSKYLLVTNSPVQVNDRVGPYVITFVEKKHALYFAEAR